MGAINAIIKDNTFFEFPEDYAQSLESRRSSHLEWQYWFGESSRAEEDRFKTLEASYGEAIQRVAVPAAESGATVAAAEPDDEGLAQPHLSSLLEIGNIGERIVLNFEKQQIGAVRPDKLALVRIVSNDTSLGFDIQSFELPGATSKKFIEVKTTKRTFAPGPDIITFFPMSSNEWETARLHRDSYYIYRVFLTAAETKICIVRNPVTKQENGHILIEPLTYRVFLTRKAVDQTHTVTSEQV
jgi:hypothetical protein